VDEEKGEIRKLTTGPFTERTKKTSAQNLGGKGGVHVTNTVKRKKTEREKKEQAEEETSLWYLGRRKRARRGQNQRGRERLEQ